MPAIITALLRLMPCLLLLACATPTVQPLAPIAADATMEEGKFMAADGAVLPLRQWGNTQAPKQVMIALHGFNDYGHAFKLAGEYFEKHDIVLLAYDQRGFGGAPQPGIWAGKENLLRDLRHMIAAVRARYPDVPLFLLGESMGGAVAINACASDGCEGLSGLILVAPAIWGDDTMSLLYRLPLWLAAHTFPSMGMTGEDVKIQATDNIPLLIEMVNDPLIIKKSRVDTIYGLVHLMDDAYRAMDKLKLPVLLLYGERDEVIPREPLIAATKTIKAPYSMAYYPEGWHMMLRDLGRDVVLKDIVTWVNGRYQPLPSGFDMGWKERLYFPDAMGKSE